MGQTQHPVNCCGLCCFRNVSRDFCVRVKFPPTQSCQLLVHILIVRDAVLRIDGALA